MTISEGKLLIEQKVDDFSKNEKQYLSKTFQETEIRTRFIDPFFQALGWDFDPNDKDKFEKCKKIEKFVKQILEFKKHGKDKNVEFLEGKIDKLMENIYEV